jgi:phage-related protein
MLKPNFTIIFYREDSGREPVREWLKRLDTPERKIVGEDLQTMQYRWPLGMPLVGSLNKGLWELRTNLPTRICRIIFIVEDKSIILLHGFIKKTQKTPPSDIEIAEARRKKRKNYGYS